MQDRIVEIVNSRPRGITVRELASELNTLEADYVGVVARRLIGDGSISHLGCVYGHASLSAILMPRLVGLPEIERTKYEAFA